MTITLTEVMDSTGKASEVIVTVIGWSAEPQLLYYPNRMAALAGLHKLTDIGLL